MNNRNHSGNQSSDRWAEPREGNRQPRNQQSRNRSQNPDSDRFYEPDRHGSQYSHHQPFEEGRYGSRFQNTSEERGFGGGGRFGGAQNYGDARQYGGSNQSGGGGGFGSPSDYGAGGSGSNYSGGYYGSSGSYGGGSNYRGGSSYGAGGNYSSGPGGAYNNDPMPAADDSAQGSYHGRTGYRSNYQSIRGEFDAVMEDPTVQSNFNYGGRQHARNYRDYGLEDNYGDTTGRYSRFNNYDGYTGREPGRRWTEDERRNQGHQTWIDRATGQVRSWFGRDNRHDQNSSDRW